MSSCFTAAASWRPAPPRRSSMGRKIAEAKTFLAGELLVCHGWPSRSVTTVPAGTPASSASVVSVGAGGRHPAARAASAAARATSSVRTGGCGGSARPAPGALGRSRRRRGRSEPARRPPLGLLPAAHRHQLGGQSLDTEPGTGAIFARHGHRRTPPEGSCAEPPDLGVVTCTGCSATGDNRSLSEAARPAAAAESTTCPVVGSHRT